MKKEFSKLFTLQAASVCVHECMHVCVRLCMHAHVCVWACVRPCARVCVCALMFVILYPFKSRSSAYVTFHVVNVFSCKHFHNAASFSTRGLIFTSWGCCGLSQRHTSAELAHSFLLRSCVCFCLYGPFNCISFHKFFKQLRFH